MVSCRVVGWDQESCLHAGGAVVGKPSGGEILLAAPLPSLIHLPRPGLTPPTVARHSLCLGGPPPGTSTSDALHPLLPQAFH